MSTQPLKMLKIQPKGTSCLVWLDLPQCWFGYATVLLHCAERDYIKSIKILNLITLNNCITTTRKKNHICTQVIKMFPHTVARKFASHCRSWGTAYVNKKWTKLNPQQSSRQPKVQLTIKRCSLPNKKPFYVRIYNVFTKTVTSHPSSKCFIRVPMILSVQ